MLDGDRGDVRHPDGRPVAGADTTRASSVAQASAATARSWVRYVSTRTGRKWVVEPRVFIPIKDWVTQETAGVTARVRVAPGDMFRRMASAQGRNMA